MPLTWARMFRVLAGLALLAGIIGLLALGVGSLRLAPAEVVRALLGTGDALHAEIVRGIRLPAVLLAAVVGLALGTAGATMQGLLRNPLADPYILGISGGAALGASLVIATGGPAALLPAAAFAGALGTVALIHGMASVLPGGLESRGAPWTLLLTGVVFNALAGAAILVLYTFLSPQQTQELIFWLMGAIAPARLGAGGLALLALICVVLVGVLSAMGARLNLISLGDDEARTLGVEPVRVRLQLFVLSSALVACAVAWTGLIGFVGLVVPHLVRLRFGADHRLLLPASALAGAAFLMLADAGARATYPITGSALPVGAVTALVGAPLFFWLLARSMRASAGGVA